MTLTGKAADDFLARLRREGEARRDDELAQAKALAATRGKEPFDLARLETMCDTSHEGRVDPVETRQAEYERMYYVHFPDVMTLAELATKIAELNRW